MLKFSFMDSIADKSISVRQQCFESFDVSLIIINLPLIKLLARRVTCSQKMAIIYEYVYQCFENFDIYCGKL